MNSSHVVGDLAVLEAAFAALEQGITIHDRDGRIVVCNPAAGRIAGLPLDEILGTSPPRYPGHDVRDESGALITEEHSGVWRALRTGQTELGRLVEVRPSEGGKPRWLRVNYQPLFSGDETAPWGVVASIMEVESPRAGAWASTVAAVAANHAPEPIVALDGGGFALHANAAARALAAEVPELAPAIEGKAPLRPILFDRVRYELPTRDDLEDDRPLAIACEFEREGGAPIWLAAHFSPVCPDTPVAAVCSLRDMTREREREQELAYSAVHDPLTGLANRRLIDAHLDLALGRAHRGEQSVGVLFLDLDGFKQINDRFGHKAGDAVLVEFAGRLTRAVRASDPVGRAADPASLVSRPGGDEFIVILTDLSRQPGDQIAGVMRRVHDALREPFTFEDQHMTISVSIGGSEYPRDGRDAQTLIERANAAMRAAKREHP
jgi:diguanylate cyclase (GGDEF)-like protein/PAS domain S-box-containing protein